MRINARNGLANFFVPKVEVSGQCWLEAMNRVREDRSSWEPWIHGLEDCPWFHTFHCLKRIASVDRGTRQQVFKVATADIESSVENRSLRPQGQVQSHRNQALNPQGSYIREACPCWWCQSARLNHGSRHWFIRKTWLQSPRAYSREVYISDAHNWSGWKWRNQILSYIVEFGLDVIWKSQVRYYRNPWYIRSHSLPGYERCPSRCQSAGQDLGQYLSDLARPQRWENQDHNAEEGLVFHMLLQL